MHTKSFKVWTLLTFLILAWETPGSGDVTDSVLQQLQESINQAVARVRPSVVSVHAKKKTRPGADRPVALSGMKVSGRDLW